MLQDESGLADMVGIRMKQGCAAQSQSPGTPDKEVVKVGQALVEMGRGCVRGHSVVSTLSTPSASSTHSITSLPSLIYIPPHHC